MSVQGARSITIAIAAHQQKTAKGLRTGLYRAGLFLQRESQKLVPVDKDILRPSANTRMEGEGLSSAVVVSYSTDYAVYVHEDLEARHKPGKCAKFLEKPLREKQDQMKNIIVKAIQTGE